MCERKETTLSLIKKDSSRQFLSIGVEGQHFLNKYYQDIVVLKQDKKQYDFFFTANPLLLKKPMELKALERSNFDKDLNLIRKKASVLLGKHLRTHNFRATFVTDLLNAQVPIHQVKEILGYSDIKSTSTYQRSSVTQK